MHNRHTVKLISAILCLVVIVSSITLGGFRAYSETTPDDAQNAPTEGVSEPDAEGGHSKEEAEDALQNQLDQLAKDLFESENKLLELGAQSKDTEEYINALDEKIGYLNEQIMLLDKASLGYQEDIDALQKEIDVYQANADVLQAEVDETQSNLDDLNAKFKAKYDAYCLRARAIYISGKFSIISALLLCDDISSFLTRYEMVKSVSKSDAQLLSDIGEQTKIIMEEDRLLDEEKGQLDSVLNVLIGKQNQLAGKQKILTDAMDASAGKKAILAADRAESDMLLASLNAKNGMYTEFRNEDKALMDAVENEIDDLINGIKNPDDVTLATTSDRESITVPSYEPSDVYSNSDAVLNMTYPAPGNYTVSCAFGKYSNGNPHNGIDFPAVTGSPIVAAQSGVVIKVEKLTHSYGNYVMIYHGTDSQGRTIVTLYAHNSSLLAMPGDIVKKGQQIARAGSTGNSTGPHCHFEIRVDNKAINPKNYLS